MLDGASDHQEVGRRQGRKVGERGEMHAATAGRVEGKRAASGIVDDAVMGVVGAGADKEFAGRQRALGKPVKLGGSETDGIDARREIRDDIEATGPEGGIEPEDVPPGAAALGVEAAAAVDRVIARPADQKVVAEAAAQEIIAAIAVEPVIAGAAEDAVIASPAVDGVGEVVGKGGSR